MGKYKYITQLGNSCGAYVMAYWAWWQKGLTEIKEDSRTVPCNLYKDIQFGTKYGDLSAYCNPAKMMSILKNKLNHKSEFYVGKTDEIKGLYSTIQKYDNTLLKPFIDADVIHPEPLDVPTLLQKDQKAACLEIVFAGTKSPGTLHYIFVFNDGTGFKYINPWSGEDQDYSAKETFFEDKLSVTKLVKTGAGIYIPA
jgi:hypothetical protein